MTIKLNLEHIRCIRASEGAKDEFYIFLHEYDAHGDLKREQRFPPNSIWRMQPGKSVSPNVTLFTFEQNKPCSIGLVFMEEDAPAFTRRLTGLIHKLSPFNLPDPIDDCLGELYVFFDGVSMIKWAPGLNVVHEPGEDDEKRFRLVQEDAFDYEINLTLL